MKEYHIEISDRVTSEITSCIADGLDRFNDEYIGYGDRQPLAVVIKDPDSGEVLGGITGRSSLGLLFLEALLSAGGAARRGGGQRTVAPFRAGRAPSGLPFRRVVHHQFSGAGLLSTAWLAANGEVPCLPPGTSRVFMTKTL